jgi:ribosomal protein S18 acetylase RimI-like enzyme
VYWYRTWKSTDLPWLERAHMASTWEDMTHEERQICPPVNIQQQAKMSIQFHISQPSSTAFIALLGHEPVGFALPTIGPDATTDELNGHLMDLWVAPAHRRRGIGRHLHHLVEAFFTQKGIRKVKVLANLENQGGVRFAETVGFQPEGMIGVKRL